MHIVVLVVAGYVGAGLRQQGQGMTVTADYVRYIGSHKQMVFLPPNGTAVRNENH